ncbi:MAG: TetR/AcrR family transcriptional regulator [Pseudomonadota bacterium]
MPTAPAKRASKPHGNSKVTRADWLHAARDMLVRVGVGGIKILTLSGELGVARSSFYWYFSDRTDLLIALLQTWETRNTRCITDKCDLPAADISHAVCHFFECFIDDTLFDQGLEFGVRDWARHDAEVRAKVEAADATRLAAITGMYARYGFETSEADARARILYFMQLGYHALDITEPMATRMSRLHGYLKGFTGHEPDPGMLEAFRARAANT